MKGYTQLMDCSISAEPHAILQTLWGFAFSIPSDF